MAQKQKASPATIEKYLKGMDFPASKEDLVRHAQDRRAPDDVMSILKRMPDREYGSAVDVAKGVGEVE